MITFRHSLTEEELAAMMPRLSECFARAGLDLDTMDVLFQFSQQGLSEEALSELNLETLKVRMVHSVEEIPALPFLKMTPWERANPNAPFWRRLKHKPRTFDER
jgi:hypothetical protein